MTSRLTTYCFSTKSFGHATMLVGGFDPINIDGAMKELGAAREKLKIELEKKREGLQHDYYFIYGRHENIEALDIT